MQVAPNQISPGEPFDVFYFVRNPLDSTTYFVRAKVYDVRTGELLSTIALTQSPTNSRLFIKTVQAPPEPSGYGRNIVAIASVYTDNAFTQQSESYEEQEQYYLIKSVAPVLGSGGSVDMRALREMMEEIVSKGLKKLPPPATVPKLPTEALFGAIGALQREVDSIPKEMDLSAVSERLSAILEAISSIPDPEPTDLTVIGHLSSAIGDLKTEIGGIAEKLEAHSSDVSTSLSDAMRSILPNIQATLEQSLLAQLERHVQSFIGGQELSIPIASLIRLSKNSQSNKPIDVDHLM